MITTCTTSTEETLAQIGDLMSLLGTTASSSGHWKALVDASVWAERYVTGDPRGSLRRQVYQETVAGYGSQRLVLSRTPVNAISRLFNTTDTGDATEYCSTSWRIENPDAGFLELTGDAGFAWTNILDWNLIAAPRPAAVHRPWLVVYEAGYQLGETSSTGTDWVTTTTGRTLPEDIERAVLMKAAAFYQGGGGGDIESMKVGPLGVNYRSDGLDPVCELLAPYRRI